MSVSRYAIYMFISDIHLQDMWIFKPRFNPGPAEPWYVLL